MTDSPKTVAGALAARDEAAQAPSPVQSLTVQIRNMRTRWTEALPRHVDVDRFIASALTAVRTTPRLIECTELSILAGLTQAAQLGLEVSDVRGQAFLIPRWNGRTRTMEAGFQLGYRGMIDLAARAGIVVDVDVVKEHDGFDFQRGTDPWLWHKPSLEGDRGRSVAYYAVAHFADRRTPMFVIMSHAEMEAHRDQFASARRKDESITGPWVDNFDGMARKTVIRALLGHLPTAAELQGAIEAEATDVTPDRPTASSMADKRPPTPEIAPTAPEPEDTPASDLDPETGELFHTTDQPESGHNP